MQTDPQVLAHQVLAGFFLPSGLGKGLGSPVFQSVD